MSISTKYKVMVLCQKNSELVALSCVWQGACVAPAAAYEAHLLPISSHHLLHKSLVVSPLRRQIIPSTMNLCVPHRSAPHPLLNQDLRASQHPAAPAFIYLSYK
ncbi:unnamed protein product [Pleuronectes platessa]|uniref:Uncharacterized protein n=1 Tax=Pleuronectes platessa TaxID=8262 RepID=A0A9N7ZE31_PLEPL|nr:unnamed protein product [Pleuronectes platessa]